MRLWWTSLLIVLVSCGNDRGNDGFSSGTSFTTSIGEESTSNSEGSGESGPGMFDVGSGQTTGPGDGQCACQDVLDGIYVLNSAGAPSVWFFDPPANTFMEVGVLGCPAPLGWVANSMAIDREGNAWLNYYEQSSTSGKLFRAPLSDLSQCEELPYQNPAGAWWLLGMGYAVTNPDSSCDQLFIYKSDRYLEYPDFAPGGAELGRYNETSNQIDIIGATDYPVGELTGTGDARLFTFAPVSAQLAVLVNLDKATGQEIEHTDLDGFDITNAFAFAFWGGDVYFFTETGGFSATSKVTRLDYDNNEGGGLTEYNPDTGLHIPGAGVSTCASFKPPQ